VFVYSLRNVGHEKILSLTFETILLNNFAKIFNFLNHRTYYIFLNAYITCGIYGQ